MTLPPNIRVNVGAPFPARVQGSGPIVITKASGVWTVSCNFMVLAVQNPPTINYPNDFILVYDSVAQSFFRAPLSIITGVTRAQRSVTATPIIIVGSDQIINCNINVAAACSLPPAAARGGTPLTFKDVGAQFTANNLTITPNGSDTIDGAASLVLRNNRQGVTLVPFNDGVNTGWAIE